MRMASIVGACLCLTASTARGGEVVSHDQFFTHMAERLVGAFCSETFYVHDCFTASASQCKAAATEAVGACFAGQRAGRPSPLAIPADTVPWGRELGSCSLKAVERTLAAKRRPAPMCSDQASWGKAKGLVR